MTHRPGHERAVVGSGFLVFGEIVAASIWEEIARVEPDKRYKLLDPILFLEDGIYTRINRVAKVTDRQI